MEKKPEQPGAPSETEVKPQPSSEAKPIFSYRDLDLIEVMYIDNYRYLSFMCRGEFIVTIREFEYFSWLSYIFQEIEMIQAEGGECICDETSPDFTVIEENHKILAQKIDVENDVVVEESDKFIKIFDCYNLQSYTIIGLHENHEDIEDKHVD